jgi:hypothetical protein
LTLLAALADLRADVERWTIFPEATPPDLDLLTLRWAISRIESFTVAEAEEWLSAVGKVGDANCPCVAVARLLVATLYAVLGEPGIDDFLRHWSANREAR